MFDQNRCLTDRLFDPANVVFGFCDHLSEQLDHFRIVGQFDDPLRTSDAISHSGNQFMVHLSRPVALHDVVCLERLKPSSDASFDLPRIAGVSFGGGKPEIRFCRART